MNRSEIICSACVEKVRINEPRRKEEKIRQVADLLVTFIAAVLLVKGTFSLLSEKGYQDLVQELGFPISSSAIHYWNAAICVLASLGYTIVAVGNYLRAGWTRRLCGAILVFFVLCELIIQLADISDEFSLAEAFAVVCLLSFVPVLQYVMYVMGGMRETQGHMAD
jgi:hypothetical protein